MTYHPTGRRIGLVSCTKDKDPRCVHEPMPAGMVYAPSQLFRAAVEHLRRQDAGYYILSALHGLLHPDDKIRHYDETLNGKSKEHQREWSERIVSEMEKRGLLGQGHVWEVHAGSDYSGQLVPLLKRKGEQVEEPVRGLSIGRRRGFYKSAREAREKTGEQASLIGSVKRTQKACRTYDEAPTGAPDAVRWPCISDGPDTVQVIKDEKKWQRWCPMPFPVLGDWDEHGQSRARQWFHPYRSQWEPHQHWARLCATVKPCPIRKGWEWMVIFPLPLDGTRQIPVEGFVYGGLSARQEAQDRADDVINRFLKRQTTSPDHLP